MPDGVLIRPGKKMPCRCEWCGSDPLYIAYHDEEWGVPVHDDYRLFEFLLLEGAQAGLSWLTILKKREQYRQAFHEFDPRIIAAYTAADVQRLLANPGIVRNRLKIESAIKNARAVLEIIDAFGSFDAFLWRYVEYQPRQNAWRSSAEVPARTELSDRISKDLKNRGCNFVGSTICYAFMQAVGMVNDHIKECFRYHEVAHKACHGLLRPGLQTASLISYRLVRFQRPQHFLNFLPLPQGQGLFRPTFCVAHSFFRASS